MRDPGEPGPGEPGGPSLGGFRECFSHGQRIHRGRADGLGSPDRRTTIDPTSLTRERALMVPHVPPVVPVSLVRAFDPPPDTYGPGHRGIDLASTSGQPVRAMAAGRIAFAGIVADIPVVTVEHAGGLRSTYQPVHATLPVGTPVMAGQPVGLVAASGGHCGGSLGCVHVGLRDASTYRDPTPWLATVVLKNLPPPPSGAPAGR
jgi:murein DD-endopeptidase MepM/ murein hydrolase activator NlpD